MRSILILLSFSTLLLSQVSSGSFYGEIRDPSDALVSDVKVTIVEEKTGFQRQTTTGNGDYRVPDLAPGVYAVTAERQGFRKSTISHITLEINQSARIDLRLEIGQAHDA